MFRYNHHFPFSYDNNIIWHFDIPGNTPWYRHGKHNESNNGSSLWLEYRSKREL